MLSDKARAMRGALSLLAFVGSLAATQVFGASNEPILLAAAAYGAMCDGNHHYLPSITSVQGHNTTGWNLSQWQALYPTLPPGADITTSDIDGLAISAAAQAGIAKQVAFTLQIRGGCFASQSVDLTGSRVEGVVFDFSGSSITSTAQGVCAVDFTYGAFFRVDNINVIGDATKEPYCGIRQARPFGGAVAGDWVMNNPYVDGYFTHAAFENLSTEGNNIYHPIFSNRDLNGGMSATQDGINHFNAAASEALLSNGQPFQSITLTPGTYYSMTSNWFYGGRFVCTSCQTPLWNAGSHGFAITNGYAVNNTPSIANKSAVTLYMTPAFPNTNLDFDVHFEAYPVTYQNIFWVTGTDPTPVLSGLGYTDMSVWASQSVIGTNQTDSTNGLTPITGAHLYSANFYNPLFALFTQVPPPTMFDNAAIWGGNGYIRTMLQGNWQNPGLGWTGTICITSVCTNLVPTKPLNVNSEFISDQPLEHTITTPGAGITQVADNWVSALAGFASSKSTFQDAQDTACNGAYYDEAITVTSSVSVGSGDNIALRSLIQGPDLTAAFWGRFGGGSANPLTLDLWMDTNFSGNVALFASNYVGNQMITHDLAVTPGCHEYVWQIPAPLTSAGVAFQSNFIGLRFGVDFDCGSSFQVAPDVWTAIAGLSSACTSSTSHFLSTIGNQAKVGPARLYNGYFVQPYLAWPAVDLYLAARQQYQKSPPAGVAPDPTNGYKNKGLTGAFTFTANVTGTATVPFSKMFTNAGVAQVIGLFSTGAVSNNCYDITAGADGGAASASNISDGSFRLACAGTTLGHEYGINYTVQGQQ